MEAYKTRLESSTQPKDDGNEGMQHLVGLSRNDEAVLSVVFNEEQEYSVQDIEEFRETPDVPPIDESLRTELITLEKQAVKEAESGNLQAALFTLTKCISMCGWYSSGYNNRAQVYRLLNDTIRAMEDLDRAIYYAGSDNKVLGNAFTQRAIIKRNLGDQAGSEADFGLGARYGNEIAKTAVRSNPVAKL
ncbi:hypothetical protein SmJEL517_g04479 [Synchytrium microbalum]|uniref:Tetratricopeptide SHNi-TPR domain-containing protein n=1 Tax=Synchytrium microbalum TaxID=1806994 RepID=A0A507C4K2_9FUNG|nr:uncharacterized protein SmJEL517_g04479 [Synchytrium microbalum]TPX32463.1 hypothetical protein SmJEL517_g04479 [Synchytrium microbalum]